MEEDRRGEGWGGGWQVLTGGFSPHPRGMRSGTLPAPLVVGLGAACELASKEREVRSTATRSVSIM